jgi:hypothetical protein
LKKEDKKRKSHKWIGVEKNNERKKEDPTGVVFHLMVV